MDSKVANSLGDVPLRSLKADLRRGEGLFQELNRDAGDVLDVARRVARIEAKQMADTMDISHSLVLRGLKSEDHLSFHRLWNLSDDFWSQLIVAVARRRQIAKVRLTLEVGTDSEVAS